VRLSDATVTSETAGKPAGAPESVRPGDVSARDTAAHPLTHRAVNVGTTVFEVIDVQALGRPPGPSAEPILKPAAENPSMRIYRYELAPGATTATHTHKRPYLLIAATDVNLLMTSPDGRSMQHPVKAGDMHWVDTEVTHSLGNRGDATAVLVEFELK
jgi:quercetin dioxygenase-like cupin family protein